MLWAPLNQGRLESLPPAGVWEPVLAAQKHIQAFPAQHLGHQCLPGSSRRGHRTTLISKPYPKPREISAQAFSVPLRGDIKTSNHTVPHLHFQSPSAPSSRAEQCQGQPAHCTLSITPYKISKKKNCLSCKESWITSSVKYCQWLCLQLNTNPGHWSHISLSLWKCCCQESLSC